jgi:hypothetical protein
VALVANLASGFVGLLDDARRSLGMWCPWVVCQAPKVVFEAFHLLFGLFEMILSQS